jgi:TonB family protein
MILFVLAATQFSLPTLTNPGVSNIGGLIDFDDFPFYMYHQSRANLTVYTRTTVLPDGKIDNCFVERSSSDRALDAFTCQLIQKRAKFAPARWMDGSAVYGVIRTAIRWTISEYPEKEPMVSDLEVSVDHLPEGGDFKDYVALQIAADQGGHPVSCAERVSSNDTRKHFPELIRAACQQATANLVLFPPVDASGKPVRSVQSVSAHFKLAK